MERMFMPGRIKGSVAHADARLQASVSGWSRVARVRDHCASARRGRFCRRANAKTTPAASKPFDQAGIDQQPIKTPRFRPACTGVEQPLATFENLLLLGKRWIERQPGRLLDDQRKIGSLERVERRGETCGFEV